jgi:hypothetical protein
MSSLLAAPTKFWAASRLNHELQVANHALTIGIQNIPHTLNLKYIV